MKKTTAAAMVCGMFFFGLGFAESCWSLDFEPGNYQINSTTHMPGMPSQLPSQSVTQCLTKQEAVPDKAVGGGCQMKNMKAKGNTISWTMECKQQGMTTTGTGKMTYHGDRFEGTFVTSLGPQAGNMTITTEITGQRTGPCQ